MREINQLSYGRLIILLNHVFMIPSADLFIVRRKLSMYSKLYEMSSDNPRHKSGVLWRLDNTVESCTHDSIS